MTTTSPLEREDSALAGVSSFVLSFTDLCNINCTYCFEGKEAHRLQEHDAFPRLVETICKASGLRRSPLIVSFYGGEPLMAYRTIVRVVEALEARVGPGKLRFRIATNGVLLTPDVQSFLLAHGFGIQVSLDGPPDVINVHRKDHRGRGTAVRLVPLLARVREFPDIMARLTVTPDTVAHFARSLIYLIEVGFDCPSRPIKFDFDYSATWSPASLRELDAQCEDVANRLAQHYQELGTAKIEPLDRVFMNERPPESRCGRGGYCGAACSAIHVTPKMEFYACNRLTPSHDPAFKALMLSRDDLSFGRRPDVLNTIHPGIRRKPECASCMARHFCEQTCPARIHSSSGSFEIISDVQCSIIRATHRLGRKVKASVLLGGAVSHERFQETYALLGNNTGGCS